MELGLQFVDDVYKQFEWGFKGVFGVGVGAPILANCDPSEGVYLRFFVVNACMRVK